MKRITGIWILLALLAAAAFADIAKPKISPKTQASIDTTLRISLKDDAKEARLVIPKSQLAQLRAELDQIDNGSETVAAVTSTGISRIQTVVSGLFLSLAIVFGGIWFARSGKIFSKTGTALIIVGILAGAGATATFIYGNAGPPPEARSITGKMFSQAVHWYNFGSGKIKLETTDEDLNEIILIVPNPKDESKPAE